MDSKKNTGMAVLAYFIFFIPLLTDAKNDEFVKYHVKQGLVFFIAWVILSFVWMIPVINLFGWLLDIFIFVLWIMGIMNASSGKQQPVPVIGKLGESFKF